jgi:hypothetical protein
MGGVGEVGAYVVPRQRFVLRPAKRYSTRKLQMMMCYGSSRLCSCVCSHCNSIGAHRKSHAACERHSNDEQQLALSSSESVCCLSCSSGVPAAATSHH